MIHLTPKQSVPGNALSELEQGPDPERRLADMCEGALHVAARPLPPKHGLAHGSPFRYCWWAALGGPAVW